MTVYDNILFGVTQHRRGLKRNERDAIVTRRLAQVDLDGVERLYPDELSGGMQKRVGLARALAMEPSIVFYDEPTSGLDPITSRTIDELIVATRDATGVTSVIVSHDIGSVFRISDRVAMLHGGELVIFDTPDAVRRSTISAVREFVSTAELAPAGVGGH
ncbi:MAG: ATP-binding cassette domain-containing protein, partial [Armatimonadetes bacterium]|nr:ATP-binding cassette domain-containing protein [Armatimonadota bacterium]